MPKKNLARKKGENSIGKYIGRLSGRDDRLEKKLAYKKSQLGLPSIKILKPPIRSTVLRYLVCFRGTTGQRYLISCTLSTVR